MSPDVFNLSAMTFTEMLFPVSVGLMLLLSLEVYGFARIGYNVKRPLLLGLVFGMVCALAYAGVRMFISMEPMEYILMLIVIAIMAMLCLGLGLEDGFFVALMEVTHIIIAKGIAVGSISLAIGKNMYHVLLVPETNGLCHLLTIGLAVIIMAIYIVFVDKKKLRMLLETRNQKSSVMATHMVIAIFLLFFSYNYYYNMEMVWFSMSQILTSVIMWLGYIIVAVDGMKVASIMKVDIRNKRKEERMSTQLAQYESMKKNRDQLKMLKHDLNETSVSLNYLLEEGKMEEAKEVAQTSFEKIMQNVPEFGQLSNNPLIEALMYETRNKCEQNNIEFKGMVYVPDKCSLNEKELHECLSNLLDNAVTACMKLPPDERKLHVDYTATKNWLTIHVMNSYKGIVRVRNGQVASRSTKDFEGHGLGIFRNIVESHKGVLNINPDRKMGEFHASIHIHYGD